MPKSERSTRKPPRISQGKLASVRKLLGLNVNGTVEDSGPDMAEFEKRVLEGVRQMAGSNRIRDIYAEDEDEDGLRSGHESLRRRKPQSRSGRQPDRLL